MNIKQNEKSTYIYDDIMFLGKKPNHSDHDQA